MRPEAARASGLGLLFCLILTAGHAPMAAGGETPETVRVPSDDGKTSLVGDLFVPPGAGAHPAVVLLHGRSGPYSSLARGAYTAATLSRRHLDWSRFWEQGSPLTAEPGECAPSPLSRTRTLGRGSGSAWVRLGSPDMDDATEALLRDLAASPTDLKRLVLSALYGTSGEIAIQSEAIARWERDDPQRWASVRAWLRARGITITVLKPARGT